MDDEQKTGVAIIIIIGLTAIVGIQSFRLATVKMQAVDRGHAIYCPNNGWWNWTGECAE